MRKVEFRGSILAFAWRRVGKPFRKTRLQYTLLRSKSRPIIGSLVYYKIDALEDLVANEAEQHQLETDVDHAVSSSYKQHQLETDVERVQQIIQRALQDADWVLKKYKIETSKSKV
uniref:Uncharacterized protein n=1 Tax=Timema monikensis TaxID=170555 RepID=A0A7R9EEF9_9NEOP|nr:unnamed protein product [Timema monikensis]